MISKLVLATSNQGKLKEFEDYFRDFPLTIALKPPTLEVEETGTTFRDNAILKATQVASGLGEWALADDSGLMVDGLEGAPGIYSARYAPTPQQCIERVLKELEGESRRRAQFVCAVAVASGDGELVLFAEGVCEGQILTELRGNDGFGYDPIFFVPEYNQTFAEMSRDLKNKISHRGLALAKILPELKALIKLS